MKRGSETVIEVSIKTRFSAAHRLVGYPGSCAVQHGHNWDVEVALQGEELNETGILVDFRQLKEVTARILGEMDHKDLNQLPEFATVNPTSENLARILFERLAAELDSEAVRVSRVTVAETPETRASYWPS